MNLSSFDFFSIFPVRYPLSIEPLPWPLFCTFSYHRWSFRLRVLSFSSCWPWVHQWVLLPSLSPRLVLHLSCLVSNSNWNAAASIALYKQLLHVQGIIILQTTVGFYFHFILDNLIPFLLIFHIFLHFLHPSLFFLHFAIVLCSPLLCLLPCPWNFSSFLQSVFVILTSFYHSLPWPTCFFHFHFMFHSCPLWSSWFFNLTTHSTLLHFFHNIFNTFAEIQHRFLQLWNCLLAGLHLFFESFLCHSSCHCMIVLSLVPIF